MTASDVGLSVDLTHLSVRETSLDDEHNPALAGQEWWWATCLACIVCLLILLAMSPSVPPNDAPLQVFIAY